MKRGKKPIADKLWQVLKGQPNLDAVLHIVERVFQRAPNKCQKLRDELESVVKSRQKSKLISLFMHEIEYLVDNPEKARECGLPIRIQDYFSFIDLVATVWKARAKTWQVYLVRDYPDRVVSSSDEEGYELRSKLKAALKQQGLVPGIQTEIEGDRIWFRITTTKKTKDRYRDRERLAECRCVYVVYFPGEPYFYAASALAPPLTQALAACLDATDLAPVPLSGQHIDSLRRLRQSRDGREEAATAGPPNTQDRFTLFPATATAPDQEPPIINSVSTSCSFEFRGCSFLQRPHSMQGHQLSTQLDVAGADVIGGLQELVCLGLVDNKPAAKWVARLPTAGRNRFTLVAGRRAGRQWDAASNISTTSTLLNRQ